MNALIVIMSVSVVLSVRGTLSATDIVADLWCSDLPVPPESNDQCNDSSTNNSVNADSNGSSSSSSDGGNTDNNSEYESNDGGAARTPSTNASVKDENNNLWAGEVAHAGAMAIAQELFAVIQESRVLFDLLDQGVKPACCEQGNDSSNDDGDDDGINWAAAKDYRLVRIVCSRPVVLIEQRENDLIFFVEILCRFYVYHFIFNFCFFSFLSLVCQLNFSCSSRCSPPSSLLIRSWSAILWVQA